MNLYATWDADRGSPSCVPRLFSLTLQRLALVGGGPKDPPGPVVIGVRLQGSKRILRSNEIPLPPGGAPEAELQLTFSLQYPHFLKGGPNRLQVLLQRRNRYKSRPVLGYKTLATGTINLAQVLQHPSEGGLVLVLHRAAKESPVPVAELRVNSLCSQPVALEAKGKLSDRSPDIDNFSEEEDDSFSSEQEGSDDALPGQDLFYEEEELPKVKKSRRKQPNIKQKFVALLKRFKVSEEGSPGHMRAVAEGLDELYQSLEIFNPSDDPDDLEGLGCPPKPQLRPFFEALSQSSSQAELGSPGPSPAAPGVKGHRRPPEEGGGPQDLEGPDPPELLPEAGGPPETLRTPLRGARGGGDLGASPRVEGGGRSRRGPPPQRERPRSPESPERAQFPQLRALWEQLGPDSGLPESLVLVSSDWQGQWVGELLRGQGLAPIGPTQGGELQALLSALLTRIQRSCPVPPPRGLPLLVLGGPSLLGTLLGCFVRLMGALGPDWGGLLRFLLVPLGPHPVAQYLASLDGRYGATFFDPPWRELFGRSEPPPSEPFSVVGRVLSYVEGAGATQPLPVAEAMLTCRGKSPDEDSCQKFVPFVGVVKVGLAEDPPAAPSDGDEVPPPSLTVPSTSPPTSGGAVGATPPASPSMGASSTQGPPGDSLGLQVDYWVGGAGAPKSTLRGTFRSLSVTRLPPPGDPPGATLAMTLVTREKNKKVPTLFLPKRPRDPDPKSLVVEGITRLICSPRQPPTLLTVTIDGTQYDDVRFFQLASQWPSHVKHLPVGLFGPKAP